MTKRELLIRAVLKAVADIEGWDSKRRSIKEWENGQPIPSQELRTAIREMLSLEAKP